MTARRQDGRTARRQGGTSARRQGGRVCLVGAALLAVAWGCAKPAAAPGPAVPIVTELPVTEFGYHNETSVAVDPGAPGRVAVAYQVPASVSWSADSGRTWAGGSLPGVGAFQLSGDPSVFYDDRGHLYALYIAFDRPDDYDTLGRSAHRNGIFLNRSDDGGQTWNAQASPVIFQPEKPGIPFEDKPMGTADDAVRSPWRGNVYVAWTEFRRHETVILFSRSTDGGRSFQPPMVISDHPGSPKDSVGAAEGTDVAVAADGTVFVVWSDSTGILLDRSTDGGVTFGADQLVAPTGDIVFNVAGVARVNGYPSLEIDRSSGRMYIIWVEPRGERTGILLARSADGGDRWSPPHEIPAAVPPAPGSRFFAWLGLDQKTGALVLGYYEATAGGRLSYNLGWSRDSGASFGAWPWSREAFRPGGEFLGDYTGVAAAGGVAYAAWTVTAPGDSLSAGLHSRAHHTRVTVGRAMLGAP